MDVFVKMSYSGINRPRTIGQIFFYNPGFRITDLSLWIIPT